MFIGQDLMNNCDLFLRSRRTLSSRTGCQPRDVDSRFRRVVWRSRSHFLQHDHPEARQLRRAPGDDCVRREHHSHRPEPELHLLHLCGGQKRGRQRTRVSTRVCADRTGPDSLRLKCAHKSRFKCEVPTVKVAARIIFQITHNTQK